MRRAIYAIAAGILSVCLLSGCTAPEQPTAKCTVIFEDNPAVTLEQNVFRVRRGTNLTVPFFVSADMAVTGVNYDNSTLTKMSASSERNYYQITLYSVNYSAVIRLDARTEYRITYTDGGQSFTQSASGVHLRPNTAAWDGQFERDGYVATGWNTLPDGSGEHIGFGSRADIDGNVTLYADWMKCCDRDMFTWTERDGGAYITAYRGEGDLILPRSLGGLEVRGIAGGAFRDVSVKTAVLPDTLEVIERGAFVNFACDDLYMFDNLSDLSEDSFLNYSVGRLHVNAVLPPVYSGNYFATFADKTDWLASVADRKKIVLFNGSSARFGYDSTQFIAAFPQYTVANMGVYAYSNMRPQAQIVSRYLGEGDIVISAPELDAIDMQFCGHKELDEWTFCLMEANYDMLALADLTGYTQIFGSFANYNAVRATMEADSYDNSPSFYDENGNHYDGVSYNKYGDYVPFRENNESSKPLSGVKKAYFNPDYISQADWDGLNYVYDLFAARGATVCFSYSVRSKLGLSADTTEQSIAALEAEVNSRLHAVVLNGAHDVILDPKYFFDTDNHLSTEGADMHTANIIARLKALRSRED